MTTKITVHLPKFAHDLAMDRIVVSVPNVQVNFDEISIKPRLLSVGSESGILVAAVCFIYIWLVRSHRPVLTYDDQQDIKVEKAEFRTPRGGIIGNFTVSDFLSLRTSTGPITANITMLNAASTNRDKPTIVSVTSKRGEINAHLSLFAVHPESHERNSSGGVFLIDTRSYTSPINVEFHEAPINSSLAVASKTITSPIEVSLPWTFEGRFFSSSGVNLPPIGIRNLIDDPSGQNRSGTLNWNSTRTHRGLIGLGGLTSGDVTWGGEEALDRGLVELASVFVHPLVVVYRPRPKVAPHFIDQELVLQVLGEEEEEEW